MNTMKFWIITPSGATNLVTNPTPYRATTGYTTVTGTIAASDTFTRRGPKCIEVTPTTDASGVYFGNVGVTDTLKYTFSVDVKGTSGKAMRIKVEDAGATYSYAKTFVATGHWQRIEVSFTAEETASDYRLYVLRDATTGTAVFYVDGFQFEVGTEATTFFSGDTEGFADGDFRWNGMPHASTSTRSADTRAGGALLDISDYAKVITAKGLGMGDYNQVYNELVSGGALYQKYIRKPRNFSLLLAYSGSTPGALHTKRNAIIEACLPDTPMVVRYQGFDGTDEATQPLDIVCIPQVSHTDTPDNPLFQKDTLTFTVLDGYLTGAYTEGVELAVNQSLAVEYVIMQDTNGAWNNMNSGPGSSTGFISCEAPNKDIIVGGDFSNAGGDANADKVAKWNGTSFSSLTGAEDFNFAARCGVYDSAGNLYLGGNFTDVGDANGDYIVKWDGAALSSLGTGMNLDVKALAIDPSTGYLYAGGRFSLAGGVANTAKVAYWNGSTWVAMATGLNGDVNAMKFAPNGNLYIGGYFTNADGTDGDYICYWNGTAFVRIGTVELDAYVTVIAFDNNGILHIGGNFTNAGGNANADYVARWSGGNWENLGVGTAGLPYAMNITKNNEVYVTGDLGAPLHASIYRNGAWWDIDVVIPNAVDNLIEDSFIDSQGNLYLAGGFGTTFESENAVTGSQENVTNSGNTDVYPTIEVTGPGVLQGFSNFTTGKSIQFDSLTLQAGEIITMQLDPVDLKMTSNWRGNCLRYVNAGSDLGDFYLKPGDNSITFFMPSGTTAATKAYLYYTPAFWNIEGALL